MKKQIIFGLVFVVFIVAGVLCVFKAADAGNAYRNAKVEVELAGEYSKAVEKANDSSKWLDAYKASQRKYRNCAVASFTISGISAVFLVLCLIKPKSKNVRE